MAAPGASFVDSEDAMRTLRAQMDSALSHKGQKHVAKDAQLLAAVHSASILCAEFDTRERDEHFRVTIVLGQPYPPCTASLDQLHAMRISELRSETHHHGKVLMVRMMGEPFIRRPDILVVVRDAHGSVDKLAVTIPDRTLVEGEIIPGDAIMAIKEPYYTFSEDGQGLLLVEHPSDIIYLPLWDSRAPPALLTNADAVRSDFLRQKTPLQWKEDGNAALRSGRYLKAVGCYTQAMAVTFTHDIALTKTLYRNRAQANLKLGRYDAAEADALRAVKGGDDLDVDLDHKAYFRAAIAAYSLRDFARAKQHIHSMAALQLDDRDGQHLLEKVNARLHEQQTGLYDFAALTNMICAGTTRFDVGDFTNRTEIKLTLDHGRGLFATVDLEPGDLVLCEKALCISLESDPQYFREGNFSVRDTYMGSGPAGRWKSVVSALHRNPSKLPTVTDLVGDHPGFGKAIVTVDGTTVIDIFQVHDIVMRNYFTCSLPSPSQSKSQYGFTTCDGLNGGTWTHSSYINHSCLENTTRINIGDLMVFRASQFVAKGEEITTSYAFEEDGDARRQAQKKYWSFECTCALCVAEKSETADVKQ